MEIVIVAIVLETNKKKKKTPEFILNSHIVMNRKPTLNANSYIRYFTKVLKDINILISK